MVKKTNLRVKKPGDSKISNPKKLTYKQQSLYFDKIPKHTFS